jgi:aminopeptidase-like protein
LDTLPTGACDKTMMMELMTRLWPLHRTLVHDDMDRAMQIIGDYLPAEGTYKIHGYPSGSRVWTWTVPEKYVVEEAYLELLTPDGPRRIVDVADNPLHIVSYGPRFEGELGFDELKKHLHYSEVRPDAIPWIFKYYDRDWGFCLPFNQFKALPRDGRYRAVMRTRFDKGRLLAGEFTLPGQSDEYFLIVTDVCHPMQVNDSLSGLVSAVDFIRRAAKGPKGHFGIKVLFVPETIGSIAFFANNEALIPKCRYGAYSELFGHDNQLRLQRSRQGDTAIDKIAVNVLTRRFKGDFVDSAHCSTIIINDERVMNSAGVDIPSIAMHRFPYERYHTSDDRPEAMDPEKLADISLVYSDIFAILQQNYYPRRTFRGPLFISGIGLDFDWTADRKVKRALQDATTRLEGNESLIDIATALDIDFADLHRFIEAIRRKGLIEVSASPWPSRPHG